MSEQGKVPTLEESVEAAIDLLRELAQSSTKEGLRQKADAVQHADHQRRNVAQGKHPIAGETKEQYETHLYDPARGGRGYHPVTGETAEEYAAKGFPAKETAKQPVKA